MSTIRQVSAPCLANALARYHDGFDPSLIELTENDVFPGLITAQPATARKARVTGILFGRPAPYFVKRGRSIRYRLSDVLAWLEAGEAFASTADVIAQNKGGEPVNDLRSIVPIAPVLSIRPNPSFPGAVIVLVRCPYCGEEHQHGVPEGQAIFGQHRSEHCLDQAEHPGMRRKARERVLRARYGRGYIIKEDGTV